MCFKNNKLSLNIRYATLLGPEMLTFGNGQWRPSQFETLCIKPLGDPVLRKKAEENFQTNAKLSLDGADNSNEQAPTRRR